MLTLPPDIKSPYIDTRAPSCIVLAVAAVNLPNEPELMFVLSPARFVWLKALRKSARRRKCTLSVISNDFTSEAFTFHTPGKVNAARLRLPGRAWAPLAAMIGIRANAAGFKY